MASAGTLEASKALVGLLGGSAPISDALCQQIAQKMDMVNFADYIPLIRERVR